MDYNDNIYFEMIDGDTSNYSISDVSIKGDLPTGINYYSTGAEINVSGRPSLGGTFEFTVTITVKSNNSETSQACISKTSKKYKLIINNN